jgi:pyruvate formate lyase activating enzyme
VLRPALFGRRLGEAEIECRLCAHSCRLAPGQTGPCGVRHNHGGELFTSAYGRPVLLALEPIEKKYLFHAFPGRTTLSLGTAGCNLTCRYCINWRVSQDPTADGGGEVSAAEVVARAVAGGAACIALTWTEPTLFFEYAEDIAGLARAAGLAVVAKSNGYMSPDVLRRMAGWLDAINIDLKGFDGAGHRRLVGGDVAVVLANLRLARRLGLWLEVATLVVPGHNDGPDELERIARFLADELGPDTPWHLLRFYPHYQMLGLPPTPTATLESAVECGRRAGLRFIYAKEVGRGEGLHTFCPGCGSGLLRRRAYGLLGTGLRDGACAQCGRPLPGVGLDGVGQAFQPDSG